MLMIPVALLLRPVSENDRFLRHLSSGNLSTVNGHNKWH
jgi:hypothetical protein